VPYVSNASIVSQQALSSTDFELPGISSNTGFATSSVFQVSQNTVFSGVTSIFASVGGATSTTVSVVCNDNTPQVVAMWTFDISLYTSPSTLYYVASSTPSVIGTVTAERSCYVQWITGDFVSEGAQELPRNTRTSGLYDGMGNYQPYYVLYGDGQSPPNEGDPSIVYPIPTIPSYISTSTLATFCDNNFPFDNSSIVQATLTYLPNGICKVATILIVPSSNSLSDLAYLASTTQGKVPFSYVFDAYDIFSGLTASSTGNIAAMSLSFPDISSSTPFGSFIPTSVVGLSTSTISTYLPESVRLGMLGLQRVALWSGLAFMFYRRIIPHKATV